MYFKKEKNSRILDIWNKKELENREELWKLYIKKVIIS